ncbi:MAG: glycosyltransferase family 4 protein [Gaiellaceae bacterium]
MRIGIVVPYSFSFWGGVVEHAEEQARALAERGVEVRILIGHDPPGRLSQLLHPTAGRFEPPPPNVIPLGRSVITPANHSLANIVLSPSAVARLRRVLVRERFDLLHVHEPLTPALSVAALASATCPIVATFHAAGPSRWRGPATALWGFLLDRIDVRIAVSDAAAETARGYSPGDYLVIPNGVRLPAAVSLDSRLPRVLFVGRHEPRKGLPVLVRAWPTVHRATGARLRVVGADPLAVRYLLGRERISDEGIDLLGSVSSGELDRELASAKLLVAPSLGRESFGMVLTRAFAAATPVVASNIDGYRQLVADRCGSLVPPGDERRLAHELVSLLQDERRRRRYAVAARRLAAGSYGWPLIAARLHSIYQGLLTECPSLDHGMMET